LSIVKAWQLAHSGGAVFLPGALERLQAMNVEAAPRVKPM
jgi:hypothetical protein